MKANKFAIDDSCPTVFETMFRTHLFLQMNTLPKKAFCWETNVKRQI